MSTGAELIAAERERQITEEGWTSEHDDELFEHQLARAAACYASPPGWRDYAPGRNCAGCPPRGWPWDDDDWKPSPTDRVRELVKAGALIAAEIDRLNRAR